MDLSLHKGLLVCPYPRGCWSLLATLGLLTLHEPGSCEGATGAAVVDQSSEVSSAMASPGTTGIIQSGKCQPTSDGLVLLTCGEAPLGAGRTLATSELLTEF